VKLAEAYHRTLDFLRGRKRDYALTFLTPIGQRVLSDLVRFCNGVQTTYRDDPREHAKQEGRREVLLRIQYHCNLNPTDLFKLYNDQTINLQEDTDA
jgi:hypothetical protein